MVYLRGLPLERDAGSEDGDYDNNTADHHDDVGIFVVMAAVVVVAVTEHLTFHNCHRHQFICYETISPSAMRRGLMT